MVVGGQFRASLVVRAGGCQDDTWLASAGQAGEDGWMEDHLSRKFKVITAADGYLQVLTATDIADSS